MANIELVLKLKLVLELELVLLELVLVKLVDFTIEIANPQWQVDLRASQLLQLKSHLSYNYYKKCG